MLTLKWQNIRFRLFSYFRVPIKENKLPSGVLSDQQ